MSTPKKIKVPNVITEEMLTNIFTARELGEYTDDELGQSIAVYEFVEKFMRLSKCCSCTLTYLIHENESLRSFKENRERKDSH